MLSWLFCSTFSTGDEIVNSIWHKRGFRCGGVVCDLKLNNLSIGQCVIVFSLYSYVSAEKVNELQEQLNKKDQEMKVMEDRYKKYLEKAKSVSLPSLRFVQLFFIVLLFHGLCFSSFSYCSLVWSSSI